MKAPQRVLPEEFGQTQPGNSGAPSDSLHYSSPPTFQSKRKLSKARIAVVSPFVDKRHGTERCLAEQIERLAADYDIHLFSSRVDDIDLSRITWHRVPELPGPHLTKYLLWFAANRYCRWRVQRRSGQTFALVYSPGINCLDADIIEIHIVFAEFLRQMRGTLRFRMSPVRSRLRLLHRFLFYRLIVALEKKIYAPGRTCLASVSHKTWNDLERHYGPRKPAVVLFNGVDSRLFSPEVRLRQRSHARASLGIQPSQFALLVVGNDFKKKGLACLLEAVRIAGDSRLLVMACGQDDPAPFERYRVGPNAVPVMFLPIRKDVEFYYAAADAYVGPSIEDAFPIPPLEAMASGLPAIVSRQSGTTEVVTHGWDALVLEDPNDADELAGLVRSLIGDASLREAIAKRGAETAGRLTWDANAKQLAELFEDVLSHSGRAEAVATRKA